MLDRSQPPAFHVADKVPILQAKTQYLDNGIPVHLINAGGQPVLRVELFFKAGALIDPKLATSFFVIKMLREGTSTRNTHQISEYIDQYGAFIEFKPGPDRIGVIVYTLSKYLDKLLVLITELLNEATFPEKELDSFKNITRQNLLLNLKRNGFRASRKMSRVLFGRHPYGLDLTEAAIDEVSREDLQGFYHKYIKNNPCDIIVSGDANEEVLKVLNKYFGGINLSEFLLHPPKVVPTPMPSEQQLHLDVRENATQSSIRMGGLIFTKSHPEYSRFIILNEIFGGYFGSRLMSNIREDKGYTYGIYARVALLEQAAYYGIMTDVRKEFTQHTIDEIHKESKRMRTELVPEEELSLVKNYMSGTLTSTINSPFALADVFKGLHFHGLDYSFYDNYFEVLKNITPEDLMELANKYLRTEEMYEIVVGGK
ncbi:M16 family metallopeptidase [Microscilla marina]|uniref:M16 family metallopeptidase n=1 Tax=Microscilla marina TaxID=1027 RepID=UPI0002E797F6|nr:pitrilysin family protein [Microscilla marina]